MEIQGKDVNEKPDVNELKEGNEVEEVPDVKEECLLLDTCKSDTDGRETDEDENVQITFLAAFLSENGLLSMKKIKNACNFISLTDRGLIFRCTASGVVSTVYVKSKERF